jgi:hypothetical protein
MTTEDLINVSIVFVVLFGLFMIGYCYYTKITFKQFFMEIIDLVKYATGG